MLSQLLTAAAITYLFVVGYMVVWLVKQWIKSPKGPEEVNDG